MAEKGHTGLPELPLMRNDDVIVAPVVGIVARCPNHPANAENWEKYANFIVTAVNTYPAVEGLVKALEGARQFITNGIELGYIRMPDSDTPDPAHQRLPQIEAALSRFRSLQNGGES